MKNYVRREVFILRCFIALLQRNFKKYVGVAGITYWLGASGLYKAAKPTYFFCRYVDDLADGDRQLPSHYQSFSDFIERMKSLVQSPQDKDLRNIELVLMDAMKKLKRKALNKEVVRQELTYFLDSMLVDYDRRMNRTIMTQGDINELYDNSFSSVLHLTFIGTGTKLKREYIKLLGLVQGKLYGLQDLEEDLAAGIINVPAGVIENAPLTLSEIMASHVALERTVAFQEWQQRELRLCQQYLFTLRNLDADKKVRKIISILTDPLDEYLKSELPESAQLGTVITQ